MKVYKINEHNYELQKNFREGFEIDEVTNKLTDYFDEYDYVAGDWAYGKMRLKGFFNSDNKKVRTLNDIKNFDNYIENYCAKNCRYFLIKKIN